MSNLVDKLAAINNVVTSVAANASPPVKIEYDNSGAEEEIDKKPESSNTLWCRVTLKPGRSQQMTMGATLNRYDTSCILLIQIFGVEGQGTKTIEEFANTLRTTIISTNIADVRREDIDLISVGKRNGWWQINIAAMYRISEYL